MISGTRQPTRQFPGRVRTLSTRRGQALLEFAIVSLILYLLLAAIFEFGRAIHGAQVLQQAADVCAKEISRMPLPAELTFEQALAGTPGDRPVRSQIYDPHYLVLDLDTLGGRPKLEDLIADLPPVNQQLFALMVFSEVGGRRLLRYPGALVTDDDSTDDPVDPPSAGLMVLVPLVTRDGSGGEAVRWVEVVEDIQTGDPSGDDPSDPFHIASPQKGLVALRINYPFQAASLSSFRPAAGPFEPNIGTPQVADDDAVSADPPPQGGSLVAPDVAAGQYGGTYGGPFGLGEHGALGSPQLAGGLPLRPFRRVISAQAIYRREVFAEL